MADHRMMYDQENQNVTASHRMAFDRMAYDRMAYDRMAFDRMLYERMGSASNRIHSMRNPPVAFNPEPYVKDSTEVVKRQKMFRMR